jgi:hypothetical protein
MKKLRKISKNKSIQPATNRNNSLEVDNPKQLVFPKNENNEAKSPNRMSPFQ